MGSGGYTHYLLPHAQIAYFDRIRLDSFIVMIVKSKKDIVVITICKSCKKIVFHKSYSFYTRYTN